MALLGATVAVVAPPACVAGPGREDVALQQLRTRMCEKARECGCAPSSTDDTAECGGWPPIVPDPGFDDDFDPASSRAFLAFDPACVERWTSFVDALSCEVPTQPSYDELCPLYHGTLREGDACFVVSLVESDCDRGLYCIAGICRDPSRTAFGRVDEPCDRGGLCDEGLVCLDALCHRRPGAGEPCLSYNCNDESYCDAGFCEALPGPGERCDTTGQCLPGSFCRFDPVDGVSVCQATGDVGDPCTGHRQCLSGNCPAGFCEEPADVGDPCGSQLPCGPDLLCDAGQCRPSGDGAPTGSACSLLEL
jgi:hypothetical protein